MIESMNLAWCVRRWAELHPNKAAIIFEDDAISYGQMSNRVDEVGSWLQSIGIEKGDRVAVLLKNCPEFMYLFLACSLIGAIFVPINFRTTGPELDYFIRNSRPRLFIHGKEFFPVVESLNLSGYLPPIIVSMIGGGKRSAENRTDFNVEIDRFKGKHPFLTESLKPSTPEEPHVIMYTSGTTGNPKGAVLTHLKTFFNCLNADIFFDLQFSDIMLIFLPLFHSGGLFIQAAPALFKGATIVLHRKFDPKLVYGNIEKYRVTKFLGVPTAYRELVNVPSKERADISSLKVRAGGGEKLTEDLMQKCFEAGLGFRQIMGQTETSILLWASEKEFLTKPGTVGRPVFHAEVDIFDKSGKPVEPRQVGEIVVRGSIMMKEYWQDPLKTDATIKNGYLHTGDLAWKDEDGYFFLAGRSGDMYISGGENVYPAEVEKVLKNHPDIEEVAVIGVADDKWGETGHAFVMARPTSSLTEQMVIAFCEGSLSKYKWPSKVTFVKEFPRTSLGKIRKNKLIDRTRD